MSPDPLDDAAIVEEVTRVQRISDIAAKAAREVKVGNDTCVDCGDALNEFRRSQGRLRCVDCQNLFEIAAKGYKTTK